MRSMRNNFPMGGISKLFPRLFYGDLQAFTPSSFVLLAGQHSPARSYSSNCHFFAMRRGFLLSPQNPKSSSSSTPKPPSSSSTNPKPSPSSMRRGFLLSPLNPKTPSSSSAKSSSSTSSSNPKLSSQNPKSSASKHEPSSSRNPKPLLSQNPTTQDQPDRLSSLPDPIVQQILSLLPIDDMVRTSVLSRRFLRQWTHSPRLHFTRIISSVPIELEDYPSIVDLCLSQCSPSPLISLRFPLFQDPDFPPTLARWMRFASACAVQELALAPFFIFKCFIEMPLSLFDCCSLTLLKLNRCSIPMVPLGSKFPSLRTLVLTLGEIKDRQLADLLSCCPRIESASIGIMRSLKRVVIRAPFLKHLMVYNCKYLEVVDIVEAPELRRLMYTGDLEKIRVGEVLAKIEEVALISMATCPFKNDVDGWKRLVAVVTRARCLCISNWIFEVPMYRDFGSGDQPIIFKNVKELHWWEASMVSFGITMDSFCGLLFLFRGCPFLEQFCMQYAHPIEPEESMLDFFDFLDFDDFQDDVGCELSCLKKVRIIGFAGTEMELTLLRYLASKAAALETLSLHYVGEKKDRLRDISGKFNNVRHASPYIDISVQEFDEDKVCPKHYNMWQEHLIM